MFTGIVKDLGTIKTITPFEGGLTLDIDTQTLPTPQLGESIAINGICSTVTHIEGNTLQFDYMKETLDKTTLAQWQPGDLVNLEDSLTLQDKLGGHMVSGHIDTTGTLEVLENRLPWGQLEISFPPQLKTNIIPKGSIAIDGIEEPAELDVRHPLPRDLAALAHGDDRGAAPLAGIGIVGRGSHDGLSAVRLKTGCGRRGGQDQPRGLLDTPCPWVPDLRPAHGRASIRDDKRAFRITPPGAGV